MTDIEKELRAEIINRAMERNDILDKVKWFVKQVEIEKFWFFGWGVMLFRVALYWNWLKEIAKNEKEQVVFSTMCSLPDENNKFVHLRTWNDA